MIIPKSHETSIYARHFRERMQALSWTLSKSTHRFPEQSRPSTMINIVLTVKIHERRRISIQQWKMGNRSPFPVQKMKITKTPAPNCERIKGKW
ncbi:hypothetical protein ACN38_g5633 [Penicillium nordicum]|uniref:Uncharacterized protein n=1 Tax=Penicillium nordicum TaxID=229535 RepID=A0A0M9WG17_9EURO|nr:hypothetical protein ACN38_g5633 [Penicillium nordicum]